MLGDLCVCGSPAFFFFFFFLQKTGPGSPADGKSLYQWWELEG